MQTAVDLSGRPYLVHEEPELIELIGTYDDSHPPSGNRSWHLHRSTSTSVITGRNAHHIVEAQFRSVARALRDAVALDSRVIGLPSTRGTLST